VAEVDEAVDEAVVEKRRRGRGGTALLLTLLVLAGLLFAADRAGAVAAEKLVARQTRKELAARHITTPHDPSVDVGGFPFLTQVARGRYDRITITLRDVKTNDVTLPRLDVVATGVHASTSTLVHRDGKVTAERVTGTALLGWDTVRQLLSVSGMNASNIQVSHATGDRIKIRIPLSLAGARTTLVAVGAVQPTGNGLTVKIADVAADGGNLPAIAQTLLAAYKQQLTFKIKTPPLPYGMKVKQVHPTDAGIDVTASADQVPISGQ
jgi:hypothetical protein